MAIQDSTWHPGIGDPTVLGWLTVLVYGWVAWSAWQTLKQQQHRSPSFAGAGDKRVWILLLGAIVLLGINKQLDLQTWFTQYFKAMALQQGWYADRQRFQIAFIIGIGTLTVCGALAGWRWLGAMHIDRGAQIALVGLMLLATFVMIRASSFHHIDQWLGMQWGPMRWNHALELGALGIIAWGSRQARVAASAVRHPDHPM